MSALKDCDEEELLLRINNEIQEIRHVRTLISNNDGRLEVDGLTSPIDRFLLESSAFSSVLEDRSMTDCSINRLNPVRDLDESLQNELKFIHSELDKILMKIEDRKDFFARLERNSKDFDLLSEASKNPEILHSDIDAIERNIKIRFMKEKKELKSIVATLFLNNLDVQDLFAQIVNHYMEEGPDKYMQIEESDDVLEQIELLLRTELFEVNPHNATQIKMIDLL